jgi:hypothetical protein
MEKLKSAGYILYAGMFLKLTTHIPEEGEEI